MRGALSILGASGEGAQTGSKPDDAVSPIVSFGHLGRHKHLHREFTK
jgi:hypothetical protein